MYMYLNKQTKNACHLELRRAEQPKEETDASLRKALRSRLRPATPLLGDLQVAASS